MKEGDADYEDPLSWFFEELLKSARAGATILLLLFLAFGFAELNFASYITIKNIILSGIFLGCIAAIWSNLSGKDQLEEILEESKLPVPTEAETP